MKPKFEVFKVLGFVSMVLGAGLTVLNGIIDDKKMDEKIEEGINKALAEREEKES